VEIRAIIRNKEDNKLKGLYTIIPITNIVEINRINRLFKSRSLKKTFSFLRDKTKTVDPKTKERFATFEPITFPITIEPLFSKAAKKLVKISGAEVPKAITVEPIRKGEMPNFFDEATEYLSSFSELNQIRIIPIEIKEIDNIIKTEE